MIPDDVLAKYVVPGKPFIETGTDDGRTVERAFRLGACPVYSVEIDEAKFLTAKNRFYGNPSICIVRGFSVTALRDIMPKIVNEGVFWLDAHDAKVCPVLKEIDIIGTHNIKSHTILVDDLRYFRTRYWGISLGSVVDRLINVNAFYGFTTEHGHSEHDILVAKVRSREPIRS